MRFLGARRNGVPPLWPASRPGHLADRRSLEYLETCGGWLLVPAPSEPRAEHGALLSDV